MGDCVMGKVLIDDLLHLSLGEKLPNRSTVSMQSCSMKSILQQVPVVVTAELVGAKPIDNNNIPTNLLTPGLGLKPGEGLKCHLQASHDLFDYEFQEDEKYKIVNVSYNKNDTFSPQRFGKLVGEENKFFFWSEPRLTYDQSDAVRRRDCLFFSESDVYRHFMSYWLRLGDHVLLPLTE
ncbi:hypothetical protein Tco_1353879, partial [Tanacetum coccineum]